MHPRLRHLYELIGSPSHGELSKHAKLDGLNLPKQTISALLKGSGRPYWRTVETFVRACARYGKAHRCQLPADLVDVESWRSHYDVEFGTSETSPDVEVLLSYEHDEYPPLLLKDIFIAPDVKADPPPVELPREPWSFSVVAPSSTQTRRYGVWQCCRRCYGETNLCANSPLTLPATWL